MNAGRFVPLRPGPRGYKTFFLLNSATSAEHEIYNSATSAEHEIYNSATSAEHEIYTAYKYQNSRNQSYVDSLIILASYLSCFLFFVLIVV